MTLDDVARVETRSTKHEHISAIVPPKAPMGNNLIAPSTQWTEEKGTKKKEEKVATTLFKNKNPVQRAASVSINRLPTKY